jgi:HD-like signal output (HDOD) protein
MATILLVDQDLHRLALWSEALRAEQPEWSVVGTSSREGMWDVLSREQVEAVVVEAQMRGAKGLLLEELSEQHPEVMRLAICAEEELLTRGRLASVAHRVLASTCLPHEVVGAVQQVIRLRVRLQDPALRRLVASLKQLPSLPSLYRELIQELRSPEASLQRIGRLIAQDPGMSAKVLQIANSLLCGFAEPIANPAHAAVCLGLDLLTGLVLLGGLFAQFEGSRLTFFCLDVLWRHSLATAQLARAIAREEEARPSVCDQASSAGLLHDVGTLVLATRLPERYSEALALAEGQGLCEWEAERQVLGTTHADLGAYLLSLWGIDHAIVEAVLWHHEPARGVTGQGGLVLVATHVADALDYDARGGVGAHSPGILDEDALEQLGFSDRLPHWLALSRRPLRCV